MCVFCFSIVYVFHDEPICTLWNSGSQCFVIYMGKRTVESSPFEGERLFTSKDKHIETKV